MTSGLTRRLIVAVLCVPLAACSVVSYRQPVADFAQATKDTEEALAGLDKQVTDGYTDVLRQRVLNRTLQVQIRDGDCRVESERCRIVVKDREGNEQPFPPNPPMQRMLLLMGLIRSYADGLAAIVTADTAAQVNTQVGATVGSLQNLAKTVANLGGPDSAGILKLGDYATPVGNAVNWLAGQYIARVQLDGLRRATVDARPVIAGAAQVFAAAAAEASRVPRALLAEEVSLRIDAVRRSLNEQNIDDVAKSAARYDGLLSNRPPAVFKQLQESHDALVAKIQDENVTLAEVVARIEVFAAEAQALAQVVRDLQAVGRKKEG
jgi:hypothetical protein